MSRTAAALSGPDATKRIDELVESLGDWRADTLIEVRRLIHEAVPDVVETWKWMGSPVWEKDGILAVGNAHQQKVKLTFPKGAQLPDPELLFNNGKGGAWRAIDLYEGNTLDAQAFQTLVRAAASHNADRPHSALSAPPGPGRRAAAASPPADSVKGVRT